MPESSSSALTQARNLKRGLRFDCLTGILAQCLCIAILNSDIPAMTPAPSKTMRGFSGARWQLVERNPSDEALLNRLQAETGEHELLLRCLLNRGIAETDSISRFLNPTFPANLHAPALLRDMPLAVERLRQAIQQQERILVVTDFDVDGTTSSVILSQTLRLLGAADLLSCYIPDRFTEGYGLSKQIIEKAASEGIKLILTADIGIKSHAEARLAKELGLDLIICDHHPMAKTYRQTLTPFFVRRGLPARITQTSIWRPAGCR
jgi:hypothetical protein